MKTKNKIHEIHDAYAGKYVSMQLMDSSYDMTILSSEAALCFPWHSYLNSVNLFWFAITNGLHNCLVVLITVCVPLLSELVYPKQQANLPLKNLTESSN